MPETRNHAIFHCPILATLWSDSGCASLLDFDPGASMCDVLAGWRGLDNKMKITGCYLAWVLWGERNNLVFNNKTSSHGVMLARVSRYVEENGKYAGSIYIASTAGSCSSPRHWVPPQQRPQK